MVSFLLHSWSKDQTDIAMGFGEAELHAACMAAQQTPWERRSWLETWVHLDALELQVDDNAATEITGRVAEMETCEFE